MPSSAFLRITICQILSPKMTTRKSARFRARRCFSRYPFHYRVAFAFSAFLYPQHQQRPSRFACRCRQHYGLTLFRMNFRTSRTLPIRRRCPVHDGPAHRGHTYRLPFWFKPVSTFGLYNDDDVYRKFTYVGRAHSSLAPHHVCARRFGFPSRVGVPSKSAVTLSPELHTEPLPVLHVWVGNG
jgi:hypothetical protein